MKQHKPIIYLVPGTLCNELLWSRLLPPLKNAFEVFYLAAPLGERLDDMLMTMMNQLPNQAVHLVGFSLGSYLSSLLATRHPERVKSLFLIANSSGALPKSEIQQRQQAMEFVQQHGYAGMSRRKAASLIDQNHPDTDAIIALIRHMDKQLGQAVFEQQMRATTHRPDLLHELSTLTIPTHFYYSHDDGLVDNSWIHDVIQNNPAFSQTIQPGRGHMLPLERPETLLSLLNDWLNPVN